MLSTERMGDQLPEFPATPRTHLYRAEFLDAALERFDREGLWLLLSIHDYGWRAHRDMAALLLGPSQADGLGDDLGSHHREHRAMAALEELFLLLDQLWRVVSGIQSQRSGGGFLSGYRRRGDDISSEFDRLRRLTAVEWQELFALPGPEELPEVLFEEQVVDLRGLIAAREMVADQIATAMRNMDEASLLFSRYADAVGQEARSVRDISNAYRHGTQVVYDDVAPSDIPWRIANPEESAGLLISCEELHWDRRDEIVNILLEGPDEDGHARFASQLRDPGWARELITSMQHLSVLLHKLVVSFILSETLGGPVVGSLALDWDELDRQR